MAEYLQSVQGEEDDDDEAEFQPGDDEEEDEDADFDQYDDDDDDEYDVMEGSLSLQNQRLVYQGKIKSQSFQLSSVNAPIYWKIHNATASSEQQDIDGSAPRMRTISMEGTFGSNKCKLDVTLTASSSQASDSTSPVKKTGTEEEDGKVSAKKPAAAKSTGDDDDDAGGKKPSSATTTSSTYRVFGKGSDASGAFEFYGTLSGGKNNSDSIPLECQKRIVARPTAAVASAAAAAPTNHKEEDDNDDNVADEGVDVNELIALHEEAGMSLTELGKRLDTGDHDGGRRKRTRTQAAAPPVAAAAAAAKEEEDDESESDEDYGF